MLVSVMASCGGGGSDSTSNQVSVSAPANVAVDEKGLVTWDKVDNATAYYVFYGDKKTIVTEESFQLPDVNSTLEVSVQAIVMTGNGNVYTEKSQSITYTPYVEPFDPSVVKIAVKCDTTEIKSGASATGKGSATFTASISGAESGADLSIIWNVVSGGEYLAKTQADGNKFTVVAKADVKGDKDIIVSAASAAYPTVSVTKSIAVVSKPVLTQAMIDKAAAEDKIGFEGYVQVDVYERNGSKKGKLATSQTSNIRTNMSGDKDPDEKTRNTWSAEYYNGNVGINQTTYCRKDGEGDACEIGVSLMNEERLYKMKDDAGNVISWEKSGFYNNFVGLSVSDFYLDEDTWRYTYDTKKNGFDKVNKMIASANPYEFDAKNLELIIDSGEIIGISSVANDSYSIVDGYISVQTLRTVFNVGDNVQIKTIGKFKTLEEYKNGATADEQTMYERLSILNEAVSNMRSLKSYTAQFSNYQVTNLGAQVTTNSGYDEIVTENYRYFKPCDIKSINGETVRIYDEYGTYGYKKINGRSDIYNAFFDMRSSDEKEKTELNFAATRAFTDDFDNSKASFAFSPEIFTMTAVAESDDGTEYYFYADETMSSVATTLYKDLGNDAPMYGIFAKAVKDTAGNQFPFITVKKAEDGKWYIDYAAFYYDLGLMTGLVQITYTDYDKSAVDQTIKQKIDAVKTRELPKSWSDVDISIPASGNKPERTVKAKDYMFGSATETAYFGNSGTLFPIRGAEIPFFGDKACLGDTYGLGMATSFTMTDANSGSTIQQNALVFYYDVPVDLDYTITTSVDKVKKFLTDKGFEYKTNGIFKKGNLCIRPVDSSLDMMIYVWTEEILDAPENVKVSADRQVTWDKVANAESYVVYVDGVRVATVRATQYTLAMSYADGKEHVITIVATANKYISSSESEKVIYKS